MPADLCGGLRERRIPETFREVCFYSGAFPTIYIYIHSFCVFSPRSRESLRRYMYIYFRLSVYPRSADRYRILFSLLRVRGSRESKTIVRSRARARAYNSNYLNHRNTYVRIYLAISKIAGFARLSRAAPTSGLWALHVRGHEEKRARRCRIVGRAKRSSPRLRNDGFARRRNRETSLAVPL